MQSSVVCSVCRQSDEGSGWCQHGERSWSGHIQSSGVAHGAGASCNSECLWSCWCCWVWVHILGQAGQWVCCQAEPDWCMCARNITASAPYAYCLLYTPFCFDTTDVCTESLLDNLNWSKQCIAVSKNVASPLRETHMPYGITQCYLPPSRGENPTLTPSRSRYSFSDPGGMQGWVDLCYVKVDRLWIEHATYQSQVQRLTALSDRVKMWLAVSYENITILREHP